MIRKTKICSECGEAKREGKLVVCVTGKYSHSAVKSTLRKKSAYGIMIPGEENPNDSEQG